MMQHTIHSDGSGLNRPQLQHRRSGPAGNAWAVLLRELGARLPTSGYLLSTFLLAAMAFFSPLLIPSPGDAQEHVVAVTSESSQGEQALQSAGLETVQIGSREEGEAKLRDESVDALLLPSATVDGGWILVSTSSVPESLVTTIHTLVTLAAVSSLARDAGVAPDKLAAAFGGAALSTEVMNAGDDTKWDVLLALGFGLVVVFVIVLWGATLAADVVQEKATRVVEILIATMRPWQLLAGKTAAITIIGLLQVSVVLGAAFAGLELFSGGVDLTFIQPHVLVVGLVSVVIGVPLLSALMAALAARVEHQDDVGTATQPVYLIVLGPFVAAVYAGLYAPDGLAMQLLSLAPLTNIFAMPARVAVGGVPAWELCLSFVIALLTLAATITLAGRIYSGSILRAGSTVTLRQALSAP